MTRRSTFGRPSPAMSAPHSEIIRADRSMPVTWPSRPTASARAIVAAPRPHPASRTRSPGAGAARRTSSRAIGVNHGTPTES